MARELDDEALSWGDEHDQTHAESERQGRQSRSVNDAPALGDSSEESAREEDDDAAENGVVTLDAATAPDAALASAVSVASGGELLADESSERSQLGSFALISLGVLGGLYLLYALAWLSSGLTNPAPFDQTQPIQLALYQLGQGLAVLSAPLWFVATVVATRRSLARRGIPWLILGALVLIPWPYLWTAWR